MLIDAHLHVWSARFHPRDDPLPLICDGDAAADIAVSLDDVESGIAECGVDGLVLVGVANSLDHSAELLAAARYSARPTKVVGWLPLTDPDATAQVLEYHANEPHLAGVRHRMLPSDDPALLLSAEVVRSLRRVEAAGLVLDVLPWPARALSCIPPLTAALPELPIVIDVLGWPRMSEAIMQPWTDHMAAAAQAPTVSVKVGALQQMSGERSGPQSWRPYLATLLELFGAERIMIGSNWPSETVCGAEYIDTMTSIDDCFDDLTPAERTQVRATTAATVYGFDDSRIWGGGIPGPAGFLTVSDR